MYPRSLFVSMSLQNSWLLFLNSVCAWDDVKNRKIPSGVGSVETERETHCKSRFFQIKHGKSKMDSFDSLSEPPPVERHPLGI